MVLQQQQQQQPNQTQGQQQQSNNQSGKGPSQLHYITYHEKEILFIHTGLVGGIVAHYHVLKEKPNKKFVELNKMTADFRFVDAVGASPQCIYIPIVRLIRSTLRFPIDTSSTI